MEFFLLLALAILAALILLPIVAPIITLIALVLLTIFGVICATVVLVVISIGENLHRWLTRK